MRQRILQQVLAATLLLLPQIAGVEAQEIQGFRAIKAVPQATAPITESVQQVSVAPSSDLHQAAVRRVLEKGYQLERDQLWSDALVHYEDASRKFPNQLDIRQRLQVVRIQYDLSRRYADGSFVHSTRRLAAQDALDLYREVCVKIQSHYVEPPNWQALLQRGIRNIEVALRDEDFSNVNRVQLTEQQNQQFIRYLLEQVTKQALPDREAAANFALKMAEIGERELRIPAVATILEFVCGATSSLDEYSTFLTPCLLYTSPSPRDKRQSRMPSSA